MTFSLNQIKEMVTDMIDETESSSENQDQFKVGVIIVTATQIGPDDIKIADFTGYPIEFISEVGTKLRRNNIWTEYKVDGNWIPDGPDPSDDEVAECATEFLLHIMVGLGLIEKSARTADGRGVIVELIGLLFVPVIVGLIAKAVSGGNITIKEFFLMEGIVIFGLVILFLIARHNSMEDIEKWNGRITSKNHDSQSCCHCRQVCETCYSTDSKGNRSSYSCNCREVCDHSRDYYWSLSVSTGDDVSISRCEPNELNVPDAWLLAKVGEPASVEHTYTNYLKADKDNLFLKKGPEALMGKVPSFPRVHSYYKTNRYVSDGVSVPPAWQLYLDELNADLGGRKQVDVTFVFTKNPDSMYGEAVLAKWKYGPKNALIVVVGVPDGSTIAWAQVVTISKVELLKVTIRDGIVGKNISQVKDITDFLRAEIIAKFVRTPMAEFEYLAEGAVPSDNWMIVLYLLAFLLTGVVAAFMHKEDVFGENHSYYRSRYGRYR